MYNAGQHKFAVLGNSSFAIACAQAILDAGYEISLIVTLPESQLPLNSISMKKFAALNNIDCYECSDINSEQTIKVLKSYLIDYIFSAWIRVLKEEVLSIPKRYCIGTHPTHLPYNRGRHPLHWLIILGYTDSALSFFIMDKSIDSGNLLLQKFFPIPHDQSIDVAIKAMEQAAYEGMLQLCKHILPDPDFIPQIQKHEQANYWRKREIFDCIIDPRMSVVAIIRLVRSYAPPYPCAILILTENNILRIKEAVSIQAEDQAFVQRKEPGSILFIEDKVLIMKADDGLVKLVATQPISNLIESHYIHPPTKYVEIIRKMARD